MSTTASRTTSPVAGSRSASPKTAIGATATRLSRAYMERRPGFPRAPLFMEALSALSRAPLVEIEPRLPSGYPSSTRIRRPLLASPHGGEGLLPWPPRTAGRDSSPIHSRPVNALLTDLYELNMVASYLRRGMTGLATFSLFVRGLPKQRGFLVAAGIAGCLDYLQDLRVDEDEIRYLGDELQFPQRDLEAFRQFRFTGDVWGVPEGRVVFAGEPLLEVTAPLPEAQLIETYVLNRITFETTIASKAARCVIAAAGRDVVDFSFRRTQGIEAGLDVARVSAIAGFEATSNVEAARRYGLVAAGTMAHSYVQAFARERDAFIAFAQDFPGRTTFLVDTYDTVSGIKDAIEVIRKLKLRGRTGVRLDSGNLLDLTNRARRLLDAERLKHVRIFVSGGLDEFQIDDLVRA